MNKLVRLVPFSLALVALLLPCSKAEAESAGLTIGPEAQLINSNEVLVSGTIPCAYVGQRFGISMRVSQGQSEGANINSAVCTAANGQQPFTMATSSYDTFHKGKAHVTIRVGTCEGEDNCQFYDAETDVRIRE